MANTPGCPFIDTERGCKSNKHHKYFPSKSYKTKLEKDFRELQDNKVQMCMWMHNVLHASTPPPEKPPREEMLKAVLKQHLKRYVDEP